MFKKRRGRKRGGGGRRICDRDCNSLQTKNVTALVYAEIANT